MFFEMFVPGLPSLLVLSVPPHRTLISPEGSWCHHQKESLPCLGPGVPGLSVVLACGKTWHLPLPTCAGGSSGRSEGLAVCYRVRGLGMGPVPAEVADGFGQHRELKQ